MKHPNWVITVEELKKELASKAKPKLLDVRQPEEYEESRIEGCTLIPLGELPERAGQELSKTDDLVIYCAMGMRSLQAVMLLKNMGFEKCRSLEGGICAWEEAGS